MGSGFWCEGATRSARSAGERERALTSSEPCPIGRRWQVGAEAKLAGTAEKKEEGAVVEEGGRGHGGLAPCVRRGAGGAERILALYNKAHARVSFSIRYRVGPNSTSAVCLLAPELSGPGRTEPTKSLG